MRYFDTLVLQINNDMKKLITCLNCTALALLLTATTTNAQSLEPVKAQMVKDWERAKAYTIEYLNTMPADKYLFKPTDSVRSFAEQMLHLAAGNVGLMGVATGEKGPAGIDFGTEHRPGAQSKDSVMYYVSASYDFCINAVKNAAVAKWFEEVKVFNRFSATRFAMMNKTFEHQTHHRGQTTIYIRTAGIKPPQEKLF